MNERERERKMVYLLIGLRKTSKQKIGDTMI